MLVDKSIDYVSLKKQLMDKFNVDGRMHEVELTYVKPKKDGCRPFSIGDEEDLQAYKFVNSLSGERSWSIDLNVSLRCKVGGDVPNTQGSTTDDSDAVRLSPAGGEDVVVPLTGPPVTQEDHP